MKRSISRSSLSTAGHREESGLTVAQMQSQMDPVYTHQNMDT